MPIVPKLKIETAKTRELIPYAGNAKEHPEWQVDQICASIEQFGMDDPIAVWTNKDGELEIVEGHGRLLACKKLGINDVPIIKLDHLDDEARRAYAHVHNQLTMNTGFDIDKLNEDLKTLNGFEWQDLGFDIPETLEDIGNIDEDEIPLQVETRCNSGDIWKLGEHRLICGDSTNPETVSQLMDGELADLLLTDPPYNVSLGMDDNGKAISEEEAKRLHKRTDGLVVSNDQFKDETEFVLFLRKAFDSAFSNMKDGGAFYIWHASMRTRAFFNAVEGSGQEVRQVLQWIKNVFAFGRQDYQWQHEPCIYGWKSGAAHYFAPIYNDTTVFDDTKPVEKMTKDELLAYIRHLTDGAEPDVLRYDKPARSELHPTTKPVGLFAHLIRNSSRPGDKVLDIFAGSGTTLIACEQMGRKAYLVEMDPHYCDVIIERYEKLTGNTAEKVA